MQIGVNTIKLKLLKAIDIIIAVVVICSILGAIYRIYFFSPKTIEKSVETVRIEYLIDELDDQSKQITILVSELQHQRLEISNLQKQINEQFLEDNPIF